MNDTIHHVDCEKKTFFAAALILRSFVYQRGESCRSFVFHQAIHQDSIQVQAHHEVLKNGLMNHKYPT